MNREPLICLHNVAKRFDRGETVALEQINLRLHSERFYALCGPSGCGKSTLLHLIGLLEWPDEGEIFYEGRSYRTITEHARFRRESIGFVFQFHHLIPVWTLKENMVAAMLPECSGDNREHRALELLDRVGLAHRAKALARDISGGERQRGAIARALVNRPKLIIADEPTGNVDSVNAMRIMKLLQGYALEEKATLLIATHDEGIALSADVRIGMQDGRIESFKEMHDYCSSKDQ